MRYRYGMKDVRLPLEPELIDEVDRYVEVTNERLDGAGRVTRCSALRSLIRRGLADATRRRGPAGLERGDGPSATARTRREA